MSRHRNIRTLKQEDEFGDDDDMYGKSVEEYDYGVSPGTIAMFTYDRSKANQSYFSNNHEDPITEEDYHDDDHLDEKFINFDEDNEDGYYKIKDAENIEFIISNLSADDKEKLSTCLDGVRGVVGETIAEMDLKKAAISANFDINRTVNFIIDGGSENNEITDLHKTKDGLFSSGDFYSKNDSNIPLVNLKVNGTKCSAITTTIAINSSKTPIPTTSSSTTSSSTTSSFTTTTTITSSTQPTKATKAATMFNKYENKPLKHDLEDFGATLPSPLETTNKSTNNTQMSTSNLTPNAITATTITSSSISTTSTTATVSLTSTPTTTTTKLPISSSSSSLNRDGLGLSKSASRARIDKLDPAVEYEKRKQTGKDYLNLVVIGHVDAGKSTLMGHLLYQLGFVSKKTMHKYEQEARKIGKGSFAFAWVLDETEEERSRGVTMDIAQTTFETPTKVITLIDAPGHKDFIPNMITGAAQADVAILVVNSTRGEFETGFEMGGQTREHAMLARSLGVTQLLVAVNKMDTVDWSQLRFDEIVKKLGQFFKQTGYKDADVTYIPCSGLVGENLTKSSNEPKLNWYTGLSLAEQIDKFRPPIRPALDRELRMCISDVFKGMGAGFAVGGVIYAGNIQSGDRVFVAPANETAVVKSITMDDNQVPIAFAGDSCVVTVTGVDMNKLTIGSILCDLGNPIGQTSAFRARIVIFNIDVPITQGYQVVLHYQSMTEQAYISRLVSQLHRNTGEVVKKKPRCLAKNTSAIVDIKVSRPICLELYSNFKELGRFMLRSAGHTVAAGLVIELHKDKITANGHGAD